MASPNETPRLKNVGIEDLQFDYPPVIVTGDEEDAGYQELMVSLEKEPAPWKPLCEAIRRDDEDIFREESLHLKGPPTLAAKKEAILVGRLDLLKLLLERDDSIEDDTVATACDRKYRDSVRMLLDFGWPIDKPVYFTASLLCTAVDDVEITQWLIETGADVNL
ncbi:hypothetical protein B0A55_12371, partial [Friedmanniomyces simplex]